MIVKQNANIGGGFSITIEATGAELAIMGQAVAANAVKLAAQALVDRIIQEKGDEIIGSIPVSIITNLAVAKVVSRIAEEKQRS